MTVKVKFSFNDWQSAGKSIYNTELGIELSMGDFHSGTVFEGTLELDEDQVLELKMAVDAGLEPVFTVFEHEDSE